MKKYGIDNYTDRFTKRIFFVVLFFIGVSGILIYESIDTKIGIEAPSQTIKDPLVELFGEYFLNEDTNNLKADFPLTGVNKSLISSYTGPTSQGILDCVEAKVESKNEGIIYVSIDQVELGILLQEKAEGTFDRKTLKEELLPVLGYATANNQLHWDWIPETYSYEFYMMEGEEPFWDCYFELETETSLFPRLFLDTQYETVDQTDTDQDGIIDIRDPDDDNDGISDEQEGVDDIDNDGIPNSLDNDSDGDGILDVNEGIRDIDSDGIPNFIDDDSDGDGILDTIEGDGDVDGDNILNYLDVSDMDGPTGDIDDDGIINSQDTDIDNDGINNADEQAIGTDEYLEDSDGNSVFDGDEDADNDGIINKNESNQSLTIITDTDGDEISDLQDDDSDGDAILDRRETDEDFDNDGIPNFQDLDSDGDDVLDSVEGEGDDDKDGIPNFLDIENNLPVTFQIESLGIQADPLMAYAKNRVLAKINWQTEKNEEGEIFTLYYGSTNEDLSSLYVLTGNAGEENISEYFTGLMFFQIRGDKENKSDIVSYDFSF